MRYSFCAFEKDHVYETHSWLQYEYHFSDFREIFLKHVHNLLEKQEENCRFHWVKADAAKASNMKQSETMRYFCMVIIEHNFYDFFQRCFLAQRCYFDSTSDSIHNSSIHFVNLKLNLIEERFS